MKLFQSTAIGPLALRNRIVMPPMATLYGASDGTVSSRLYQYARCDEYKFQAHTVSYN